MIFTLILFLIGILGFVAGLMLASRAGGAYIGVSVTSGNTNLSVE